MHIYGCVENLEHWNNLEQHYLCKSCHVCSFGSSSYNNLIIYTLTIRIASHVHFIGAEWFALLLKINPDIRRCLLESISTQYIFQCIVWQSVHNSLRGIFREILHDSLYKLTAFKSLHISYLHYTDTNWIQSGMCTLLWCTEILHTYCWSQVDIQHMWIYLQ